jgi:hypothetical protein
MRLRTAIAGYYRSIFLNHVLPGGVLGDVHRGLHHGHDGGDVSSGLRSVLWERISGQAVQLVVAGLALLMLPLPYAWGVPVAAAALAGGVLAGWLVLRAAVLKPRCIWRVVTLSVPVPVCHTATFIVAAHATGPTPPVTRLAPLALLVWLIGALPTNIGGWGPREGAAAWLFATAGLGAARGVATATVFGVLVIVASLPGGVRLALDTAGRRISSGRPAPHSQGAAHA